jgi:ankyrin repeat protein
MAARDEDRFTPLHGSYWHDCFGIAEILKRHRCANIEARVDGHTTLHLAPVRNSIDYVELLIS